MNKQDVEKILSTLVAVNGKYRSVDIADRLVELGARKAVSGGNPRSSLHSGVRNQLETRLKELGAVPEVTHETPEGYDRRVVVVHVTAEQVAFAFKGNSALPGPRKPLAVEETKVEVLRDVDSQLLDLVSRLSESAKPRVVKILEALIEGA